MLVKYLSVATKQRSQSSNDIKNANVTKLETIANVIPINSNLTAKNKARIRYILSNRSNFKLRLNFPVQSDINVINRMIPNQMPSFGNLTAAQSNRRSGRNHNRRIGRWRESRTRRLMLMLIGEEGHKKVVTRRRRRSGIRVRVMGRGRGLWNLLRV